MSKTLRALVIGALSIGLANGEAQGQSVEDLSIEIRGGLNTTMGEFSDRGAGSDAGFGAIAILNLTPALSLFGGWGRDQFDCDGCIGTDAIHSSGFEVGVKALGRREGRALPWARAGFTYHELAGELANVDFSSDRGLGFHASVGVDLPLGDVLSVAPALRFNSWTADLGSPLDFFAVEQTVRYVTLDVGAHIHLR